MDKKLIRLIMTGTHPHGQGGISAVVTILLKAGLFERFAGRYVVSHVGDGFWRKLAVSMMAPWRLLRTCWVFRPSIVHAHCSTGASFVRKSLLLSIARRWGCATVLHLHGSRFREFATDEAGWLRRRWVCRALSRSSAVIALSESWARLVAELAPAAKVYVIPNAVAVPENALDASAEPCRILFLGQVGQRKGVYELVRAVAQVRDAFPAVRLVLGGDGELDKVAELVRRLGLQEHVELLGWIDGAEKARQLQRAGIFCLPSHNEGLPIAMLEAMAAARPVVVTPVGGIPEVIKNGVNGLLVAPGDVDALACALCRLLGDAAMARTIGLQGYGTMRERFHAAGMVERLGALYEQLRPGAPVSGEPAQPRGMHQDTVAVMSACSSTGPAGSLAQ